MFLMFVMGILLGIFVGVLLSALCASNSYGDIDDWDDF